MSTTDEPGPLSTVGERYVLVELLSAGDELERWRGHDDLAGRQVLVRRFLDRDDVWRDDFRRRAAQLRALSVPGVASVLGYDADDVAPWLAETYVEGHPAAVLSAEGDITSDDALAIVGQAALALTTMHDAGAGHGEVSTDHVIVRPDGSVALTEMTAAASPSRPDDCAALARLARALCTPNASQPADPAVADLMARLDRSDGSDLADLGRTALALASAQRSATSPAALIGSSPAEGEAEAAPAPSRPGYDEDERKRVRNRLIALGAIVVIAGGVLLRIFSSGAGQATVPNVVGLQYAQAQQELNQVGLRADEATTSGPVSTVGTVISEVPSAGTRVKVGSLVVLTVVTATG